MKETATPSVEDSNHRSAGERSLLSYLLVPRPGDLIKGSMIAVTFVIGGLGVGELSARATIRALVVILVVELLIYAARYQWNDIQGFRADQEHPDRVSRGRLPGPLSRERAHKRASLAVAAARVLAVLLLIQLLPGLDLGWTLTCSILGIFGIAVVYERVRAIVTARSDETPGALGSAVVALWLVVGVGYAVRGLIGLALAVDLAAHPALALAAGVTLWAYGIAFVTSRWALEVTAFAQSASGRVVWRARSSQARQHQMALAHWLPDRLPPGRTGSTPVAIRDWAPLAGRTALLAPWNAAMTIAGAGAAATGCLVVADSQSTAAGVVAIIGAATTLFVLNLTRRRLVGIGAGIALLLFCSVSQQMSDPLLVAVPWLLLMGAYMFFTTRTLNKLSRGGPARTAIRKVAGLHARPRLSEIAAVKSRDSTPKAAHDH
jgi:4-hydroxybenzoate polyprenyltransferase